MERLGQGDAAFEDFVPFDFQGGLYDLYRSCTRSLDEAKCPAAARAQEADPPRTVRGSRCFGAAPQHRLIPFRR